ncbi:hypothetical protein K525DRAFT_215108, partial [Schizophyllum commune Loenen D]
RPLIAVSHPIATLLKCDDHIFLAIAEITALKLHGKPIEHIPVVMLREKSVELSYQLVGLKQTSVAEDPSLVHDWRSSHLLPTYQTVPGAVAHSIDPALATHAHTTPYYLFDSQSLLALAFSLYEQTARTHSASIPTIKPSKDFPYRERHGQACFATASQKDISLNDNDSCRYCDYPFDFKKLPSILAHIGSHVLYDTKNIARDLEPCGLCFRPYNVCQIYVRKTNGRRGNIKIDVARSTCNMPMNFKQASAAKSSVASPCSNAPLVCTLCPKGAPAVWRYNYRAHHARLHPSIPLDDYRTTWYLTVFEQDKLHDIWVNRHKRPKPRQTRTQQIPLTLSEAHNAGMALRYACRSDAPSQLLTAFKGRIR